MQVIVTADDLGYSRRRDEGIFRTLLDADGIVTGLSLLVTGVSAGSAVETFLERRSVADIGLHVNLTEGAPIADPCTVKSLLSGGYFLGKMAFRGALHRGAVSLDEVRLEVSAQLQKFRQLLGQYPQHADGHQHVHVLPRVRDAFAAALQEYSVPWTRLPCDSGVAAASWISDERQAFYSTVCQQARESVDVFQRHGIAFNGHFLGLTIMGSDMSVERIVSAVRSNIVQLAALDSDDGIVQLGSERSTSGKRVRALESEHGRDSCSSADDCRPASQPHERTTHLHAHCEPATNESNTSGYASDRDCTECASDPSRAQRLNPGMAVLELMVHPGYVISAGMDGGCGEGPDDFSLSTEREHEVDVLCSVELRRQLEDLGVQFTTRCQLLAAAD